MADEIINAEITEEITESESFKDFFTKLYKLEPDVRAKIEENEYRLNDNQIFLLIAATKAFTEFLKFLEQLDWETLPIRIETARENMQKSFKGQINKLNSPIITVQKPAGMSEAEFRRNIDMQIIFQKQELHKQKKSAEEGFDQDLINIETFEQIFNITREIFNKYSKKERE